MTHTVKYGKSNLEFVSDSGITTLIPQLLSEKHSDKFRLLEDGFAGAGMSLEDYIDGSGRLLIIVPDRTRRCGLQDLLPPILGRVRKCGVQDIRFLVAAGTHALKGKDSYADILGSEIVRDYDIVEHDCDGECVRIGVSQAGNPIEVNPLIAGAEKILAIGGMLPHYFAGFGGGPKLILPGCASRASIMLNHAMTIHPVYDYPPGCASGVIEDNPIIEDIIDAVSRLKPIYHIGIILAGQECPVRVFAGEIIETYKKAVSFARKLFISETNEKADAVIASPGGHPKDLDLLQSHKSLLHASYGVKEGGEILFFAECSEGVGSKGLEKLFELGNINKIRESLIDNYVMNGLAAISLLRLSERFRVRMMTKLDDDILQFLGYERLESMDDVTETLNKYAGGKKVTYFIPSASFTIVKTRDTA